jgi:hypothetical protein
MAKRVYFAFHYQDVIDFRANVVRNHNFAQGVESAGYYDHSIWETAKSTSPLALKKLINEELQGTSVTVILVGSDTWARRWVRYEIFESIRRGNRVLGIHINSVKGKDGMTKALGPSPFDNLGYEFSANGTLAKPIEWKNGWFYYSDLEPYSTEQRPQEQRGKSFVLTHWCRTYDWVADKGYENFETWID